MLSLIGKGLFFVVAWVPFANKILFPCLLWHAGKVGESLARNTQPASPTSWNSLAKDGSHVVLGEATRVDVFSKEVIRTGFYVLHEQTAKVQIVTDVPEEYQESGTTF